MEVKEGGIVDNSLLTVIMPVYNGGDYIKDALESVISQTYSDWILKIVDDGSTDDTAAICRQFATSDRRVQYHRFENTRVSPAENWNRAMRMATTPFVMMFHQDDIMHPDLLKREIEFIRRDRELVWVSCRATIIDTQGNPVYVGSNPKIKPATIDDWNFERDQVFDGDRVADLLSWRVFFNASCCMMRTKQALSIDLFDRNLWLLFDADYYARLSRLGKVGYISECLISYRHHDASGMSNTYAQGLNGVEAVYMLKKLYPTPDPERFRFYAQRHASFALSLGRVYARRKKPDLADMQFRIALWLSEWLGLSKKPVVVKWFSFRFTKDRMRSVWCVVLTPFMPFFKGSLPNPFNIKIN